MMADQAMGGDDSGEGMDQDQGGEDQDQGQGGFTVCIHVAGDGTLSVGSYPDSEADGDADDDQADYKPASSVKEAMTMALALVKSGGEAEDADDDMASGYNSQAPADNTAEPVSD